MKHARVIVQSKINRTDGNSLIRVIDEDNGGIICEIPITYGDFVDLTLKEQHAVGANATFCDWYKIGKKRLVSTMKFEMPEHHYQHRDKVAADVARMNCPKGWAVLLKEDSRCQFVYEHAFPRVFATTSICRYASEEEIEQEEQDAAENSEKEAAEREATSNHIKHHEAVLA